MIQKAADPAVQEFARWMVTHHTMLNGRLGVIVRPEGIDAQAIPQQLDTQHQAELQQLQSLSGSQFDRQYMQGQLREHQITVALFQQEANSGEKGWLISFARQSLSMLNQHLQEAQILNGAAHVADRPQHGRAAGRQRIAPIVPAL